MEAFVAPPPRVRRDRTKLSEACGASGRGKSRESSAAPRHEWKRPETEKQWMESKSAGVIRA